MCPAGNTGTLFLSDLFASLGQSFTEVLLKFFYSLKSRWFWLFVFVGFFLGAVTFLIGSFPLIRYIKGSVAGGEF